MAWNFTLNPYRKFITALLFGLLICSSAIAQNPNTGPGGPILVVSSPTNPFTKYTAEILRAEGFNEFSVKNASEVTVEMMLAADVVILGEMTLTDDQVAAVTAWVNNGGTLIAFRPDPKLATLMGLMKTTGTLENKYLLVNPASLPGTGIVNETIQFHGAADFYKLNGATVVAKLFSTPSTETIYPAITYRQVGTNGGYAVAFAYDLPKSIVYTRQGNPAWAGQKRDAQPGPIRSDDMFFGGNEPDWIDLDKVEIPQADEQQHLLSNIIILGNLHRKPLPRFWFLPRGLKAAVVMTGDDHAFNGTEPRFNKNLTQGPNTAQDVADWKAIRTTSYIWNFTPITPAKALAFQQQGFEIALHTTTGAGCQDFTAASFQADLTNQRATFAQQYPGITPPVTNRTHCMPWSDWATAAKVEAANGIRLDVNYYYWPASWVQNRPGMFTGSGSPMRFADVDGTMIDCYQVPTQMTDESGITYAPFITQLLDKALGEEGYYGVFCANMHTDSASHSGADAITAAAIARGVPVITAKQMLTWLDGRNNSAFTNITWTNNQLSFNITAATGSIGLRGMVPFSSMTGQLSSLTIGGNPIAYTVEVIKGIPYAFFDGRLTGKYTATYIPDVTSPTITNVVATPNQDKTAKISWKSTEISNSKVIYGTAANALTLTATDVDLVTTHEVILEGLSLSTTYYYRVVSSDAAGNTTTSPATSAAPLTFTMPSGPCLVDEVAANFKLGTTGAQTIVSEDGGGTVILKPALNEEFSGTALGAGWSQAAFSGDGVTTVSNGSLTISGTHVYSTTTFGPGSALEFSATFLMGNYQNIGFTTDQEFDQAPWVTFGQSAANGNLFARASNGVEVNLGAGLVGTAHRFLIKWNPTNFEFFVDGATSPIATIDLAVSNNMFVQVSDFLSTDGVVSVDWIRLAPYTTPGTFLSRVVDGGSSKKWGAISWSAQTPAGTTLALSIRTGNTATPDASWTAYTPVTTQNTSLNVISRYIQYKADLATTDNKVTPSLGSVSIFCSLGVVTAPAVTQHPAAITTCAGSSANFTSAASGTTPAVKWQVSTNGTTWTDIAGATSATYSVANPQTADNGKRYRAVWSNTSGTVNSNAALLTVKTKPVLTSSTSLIANSGQPFTYTPTGTAGASFAWTREAVPGISNAAKSGTGSINEILVNTSEGPIAVTYVYTLTLSGCTTIVPVAVAVAEAQNCTVSTSISVNFNSTSISANRKIWFNSVFKPTNLGTGTVNFNVTNSKIRYTLNNQQVTITVPNAHIRFAPNLASTTDYINNVWETTAPSSNLGNTFLTGVPYTVPTTIPGNASNVTWSMDVSIDRPGVSFTWKWNAGVYLLLGGLSDINVKPVDDLLSILNPLATIGNAGSPSNYWLFITSGAMGSGLLNISSVYSSTDTETCTTGNNRSSGEPETGAMTTTASKGAVEVEETSLKLEANVQPNPSPNNFNLLIRGTVGKTVTVNVVNLVGVVMEKYSNVPANSNLVIGDKLRSGTYYVEIMQGDQRKVIKVIKIN